MEETDILGTINMLMNEERQLRDQEVGDPDASATAKPRLRHLEEQLDQCWDLLRRRRAQQEFGADPQTTDVRPTSEVESYLQ